MRVTERELVQRIAARSDSEAFAVVVSRYADMVYTTCWRILRDEGRAADVAQETFFHLFKNAEKIRGCLGAWLHQVATGRAIDVIRQESSRRKREEAYARESAGARSATWAEVEPLVDEALERLPADLREILVMHFLEQKKMQLIAAEKAISQPTVSRRIAQALELVRADLRERGVLIGVAGLQTFLVQSMEWAPESLVRKLGKMAIAHAAGGAGEAASAVWVGTAGKWAFATATAGLLVLCGWKWAGKQVPAESSGSPPPMPVAMRTDDGPPAPAMFNPVQSTAPAPQVQRPPGRPASELPKGYVAQARPIPLQPLSNAPLRLAPLPAATPIALTNIELAARPGAGGQSQTNFPSPHYSGPLYPEFSTPSRWEPGGYTFPLYGASVPGDPAQEAASAPYKVGSTYGSHWAGAARFSRGGVLTGRRAPGMPGENTSRISHELAK